MSPLGVIAVLGAVASILAYSRRKTTSLRVNFQFAIALLSWGLLWYATASPFAAQGMVSLPKHMIAHILVMFLVPIGLTYAGALRSLWWILRPAPRRRLLSWWYLRRTWRAPKWLFNILSATVVLNAVMIASHLPRVFDYVMARTWMMQWVVEPAFLLSGLFFFHFIVSSPPRVNHVRIRYQLIALLVTVFEMLMLAMSMSIFTKASWYSVMVMHPGMAAMPGMATSVGVAFSQQRLAAGILWICGDGWAIPCLVLVLYRLVKREGSLFGALERQTSRLSGVTG
jgi:cytochrome c oxidase assembly factor CtaG